MRTGRHQFTVDKRSTPMLSYSLSPKDPAENQETLRAYGRYSRRGRDSVGPWPS